MADLVVEKLTVSRGAGDVLVDVDLHVPSGSTVAVIGRNGAGKSTLLMALAGLLKISSGEISVDGEPIQGLSAHRVARAGVALVPETRSLFPNMTVYENLGVGSHQSKWRWGGPAEKELQIIWDLFPDLHEFRNRQVGGLSGGQQQMVAIGRALAGRPKVLMLDEPTFGLSPIMVEGICTHIAALSSGGLAILIAEQNVDVAFDLAQSVDVLTEGRMVLSGRPDAVVESPQFVAATYG